MAASESDSEEERHHFQRPRGWSRLKDKFGQLAVRKAPDSPEEQDSQVNDFLRPSSQGDQLTQHAPLPTQMPTKISYLAPKLDIDAARPWAKGGVNAQSRIPQDHFDQMERWRPSKPLRRPGLTVGFSSTPPEIIGRGGDETQDPPSFVSRSRRSKTGSFSTSSLNAPGNFRAQGSESYIPSAAPSSQHAIRTEPTLPSLERLTQAPSMPASMPAQAAYHQSANTAGKDPSLDLLRRAPIGLEHGNERLNPSSAFGSQYGLQNIPTPSYGRPFQDSQDPRPSSRLDNTQRHSLRDMRAAEGLAFRLSQPSPSPHDIHRKPGPNHSISLQPPAQVPQGRGSTSLPVDNQLRPPSTSRSHETSRSTSPYSLGAGHSPDSLDRAAQYPPMPQQHLQTHDPSLHQSHAVSLDTAAYSNSFTAQIPGNSQLQSFASPTETFHPKPISPGPAHLHSVVREAHAQTQSAQQPTYLSTGPQAPLPTAVSAASRSRRLSTSSDREAALKAFLTAFDSYIALLVSYASDSAVAPDGRSPTVVEWLRAAYWWYLRGRTSLEAIVRTNATSPTGSNNESTILGFCDVARAWHVINGPLGEHPETGNARTELIEGVKALCASAARRALLPSDEQVALYFTERHSPSSPFLWVAYPKLHPEAEFVLSGGPNAAIMMGTTRSDEALGMPMSGCAARMFVPVVVLDGDEEQITPEFECLMSVLSSERIIAENPGSATEPRVLLRSQSALLTVNLLPRGSKGITWDHVHFLERCILRIKMPRKLRLRLRLPELEWGMLKDMTTV